MRYIQKTTDSPILPCHVLLRLLPWEWQRRNLWNMTLPSPNEMISQKQCHITGGLSEMRATINQELNYNSDDF